MTPLAELVAWLGDTTGYRLAVGFLAGYPLVTGVMWTLTSLLFYRRTERRRPDPLADADAPFVSVLIAAHCEEAVIEATLDAVLAQDYPAFEVVVVDDGSTDATVDLVTPYLAGGRVRLLRKQVNEGKAMALNDAVPVCRGDVVVVVDADIRPRPDVLRHLVPHFSSGRVAAVAGNPQADNDTTLLAKVQAVEFSSIVSVLRRAQRVWGRVLTVSGAVCAFRRSALVDVGLFDPEMATEDIAMTWKLQRRCYDVRYEPRAVAAMQVPETLPALWNQRRRWATGLAQVIRRNAGMVLDRRTRRMWPVLTEAVLSILWAYTAVALVALWVLGYALGVQLLGGHPFPSFWGMVVATVALVQLGTGVLLDRRHNPGTGRRFWWAAMYPLFYWALMILVTVRATPAAFLRRRPATSHWRTPRTAVVPAPTVSEAA